ncbi:MAG: hypothetical protein KDC88_03315 [Ignavibacteriae bacterium]|nr:hypothetical protein [Ignavibacteriota bacterium]MCB9206514.1 hypothetical protein [Ignavibacteriales bacterium]MCB9211200.1 hypothetical protein [Ignavibacteriales bacterium]
MKYIVFFIGIIFWVGCASIVLEPSDFAWPIETVLNIDEDGLVQETRYSFSTNVKQMFYAENQDSNSYRNNSVRIIRDQAGYYYMISTGFKNVYIFKADNGKMILHNKFLVSEFGLDLPAFNQRKPYVELLEGEQHLVYLNSDGIKGEE